MRDALAGIGMRQVPIRRIDNLLPDAPKPEEFTAGGCLVAEDGADDVVWLYDHRILVIECNASNSEMNSRKRINKEIGKDAQNWVRRFGTNGLVAAGAIQGVFKPAYIAEAQSIPIVFFWGHRLTDLIDFIWSTREGAELPEVGAHNVHQVT